MSTIRLGSRWLTPPAFTLLAFLASQCGKEPCAFGPGQCEGGSTGDAGAGATGAAGGDETGGMGGVGGDPTGGQGGTGGDPTTTTSTTTTTTSTTSTGGAGGTGGGLPVGCDPPSPYGQNCAEDVCGPIANYGTGGGANACAKTCIDEGSYLEIDGMPGEVSWVFSDFSGNLNCDCHWSFVIRLGGGGCYRVSASDGMGIAFANGITDCAAPSGKSCMYQTSKAATVPEDDMRLVITVDPEAAPEAGWVRVEWIPQECAGSGFGCD